MKISGRDITLTLPNGDAAQDALAVASPKIASPKPKADELGEDDGNENIAPDDPADFYLA